MRCILSRCSCVQLFVTRWTVARQAPPSWDSPGKNTGVGCHAFLQGIFLIQGLNPHLLSHALAGGFFTIITHLPMREMQKAVSIPGLGKSPGVGNGKSLQYSCLKNSMDGGAWQATFYGVAKSWT